MTAQAAKAAIQRTIKLNGGASYVWAAVKTHRHARPVHAGLPPELPGARWPWQASADYSAYIYDTQGPAGQRQRADQVAEHPARRGHRPVHGADLEQGPGVRGLPEGSSPGTGAAGAARTSRRWCSAWCRRTPPRRSCCAPGRSASSSRSARRCGSRSRATPSITHGQLAVLAEPARAAQRPRPSACRSGRRSLYAIDYRGIIAALRGAGRAVQRHRPARAVRALQRPAELLLRQGQGGGAAEPGRRTGPGRRR